MLRKLSKKKKWFELFETDGVNFFFFKMPTQFSWDLISFYKKKLQFIASAVEAAHLDSFNFVFINLSRNQMFFTLLSQLFKIILCASANYGFYLLGYDKKHLKRDASKYILIMLLFKKSFPWLFEIDLMLIITFFKKHYYKFIKDLIALFFYRDFKTFFFLKSRNFNNRFTFRKVKAIKKRLKKRINKQERIF